MIRQVKVSSARASDKSVAVTKPGVLGSAVHVARWAAFVCMAAVLTAADTTDAAPQIDDEQRDSLPAAVDSLVVDTVDSESEDAVAPTSLSADSSDTLLESILTAGAQSRTLVEDTAASTVGRSGWRNVRRRIAQLPPVRFVRVHALALLLLAAGAVVIWLSLTYLTGAHEKQRFLTTTRLSIMDKEVQRACRYIERNYADPSLTPETLCRSLVTSEAFVSALFERELGMTVEGFIRQVRVNRVKILLRTDSHLPLSELAEKTGFGSADALCEAFATVSGLPFEKYRDAVAANEEPETSLT